MDIFEVLALRGARIVLKMLVEKDGIRYTELQKAVGSPSTTNLALHRLGEIGYVKKEVLNEPYRPVAYSLTDRGKKVVKLLAELESIS